MNHIDVVNTAEVHIALRSDQIIPADLERFVSSPENGAICSFSGVVRRDQDIGPTEALEYDGYRAMALNQLREICAAAVKRWPGTRIAIEHRLGRVELSETSVVIAVGSPHRPASFECCRHLIEKLKADVPIWKKEISGGSQSWR